MDYKKIDLHMHSVKSNDGEYEPDKLMELCYEAGLDVVALADHNTLSGVVKASNKAKELGIKLIPAVELDCNYMGTDIHLLGYNVKDKYNWFFEHEINVYIKQLVAGAKTLEKVKELGIYVDEKKVKELSKDGVIVGETIAEVALADPRNDDNIDLLPYREGWNRSDNPYVNFYWDFCSQGKPAYEYVEYPTFKEAVDEIIKVGGIPVLAHPGNNIGCNEQILKEMVELGVQGVEVYSSYHDEATINYYSNAADKLKIFKTIGSDFHGKTKPSIKLGKITMPKDDMEIALKTICNN